MENRISNINNKVVSKLVNDFKEFEYSLKYFDAEKDVMEFLNSEFYSSELSYVQLRQRCMEYIIDHSSKL